MVSTKSRILAVDDDQNILHLLERFLDGSGFECLTASNTAAAVDLLEGNEIDLLLLDIAMPNTSGIDFLPEVVTHMKTMQTQYTDHASFGDQGDPGAGAQPSVD